MTRLRKFSRVAALAVLGVIREGALRIPERVLALSASDGVQKSSPVQGPEAEMPNQDSHDGSCFDGGLPGKDLDPADVEVLPSHQRQARALEVRVAMTDDDDLFNQSADL